MFQKEEVVQVSNVAEGPIKMKSELTIEFGIQFFLKLQMSNTYMKVITVLTIQIN